MSVEVEFRETWAMWAGHDRVADRWADSLVSRHREPWRHYHTLQHVVATLRQVRFLSRTVPCDDEGAVVAAICFHDAIYDPRAEPGANEDNSASLARDAVGELGWAADRISRVSNLIEATTAHETDGSIDADIVITADLSILAADPVTYGHYVVQVRTEYDFVDEVDWRVGRSELLRRLLARDSIFPASLRTRSQQVGPVLEAWDRRARANISAELATLVSGGE